jgi:hypothetical protein
MKNTELIIRNSETTERPNSTVEGSDGGGAEDASGIIVSSFNVIIAVLNLPFEITPLCLLTHLISDTHL